MKNIKRLKQVLAVLIVYVMVITLGMSALAVTPADFSDLPDRNHYSYSGVIAAIQNGIMHGDGNGHFMPDKVMKRVEAATYLVRVMNGKTKADIAGVTDYAYGSWYDNEGSLAIAIDMGLIDIVNGKANPDDEITREEVFEMMARAINAVDGTDKDLEKFPDAKDISNKYKKSIASLVSGGYVHGSTLNDTVVMNPKALITRAEFATLFGNVFEQYISKSGEYTNVSAGNVVINGGGITLKDADVQGDLIIGDGAGDVKLDNIRLDGRLIVRGGNVSIGGNIESIVIVNKNAKVTLAADAEVGKLTIVGDLITVNTSLDSLINTLEISGKSARISGYVLIENAIINAIGAIIESSPYETVIAMNITANIGGNTVSGTFTSEANAPTVILRLGSGAGAYNNVKGLYAAAKTQAPRNRIVIEIASVLDDVLVIDGVNFPGNNAVTVKYDTGFSKSLTYGVVIERSNVTLDGLSFYISDINNIACNDASYNVISVDGYKKIYDGKDVQIKNTTLRNCNVTFDNEAAGYNVTAVYFDSYTTFGNTVNGGNISVTGQLITFDSVGIHAGSLSLNGVSVNSNDRALIIECEKSFPDVTIAGDTKLDAVIAIELRLDKSELANMPNAFGTVFGGYSNLKHGAVKSFVDKMLNACVTANADDDHKISGVKLRDYKTSQSEFFYKDENGFVWSRCHISNTWVYCNTPVNGNFIAGRMYMLTDANGDTLTNSNTRYLKANGLLSVSFDDMTPLNITVTTVSNHPALNDGARYKAIGILPFTNEVKGLVASLTSVPYVVDSHFLSNGTEYGANDPARAGNLNSSRNGRINITVSGMPNTVILLYFNLNTATLGVKGNSSINAWQFSDGVETSMDIAYLAGADKWYNYNYNDTAFIAPAMIGQLLDYSLAGYGNLENPLTVNRQEIAVEAVAGVNTIIIKGDDGNTYCFTVTVRVG